MTKDDKLPSKKKADPSEVAAFLNKVSATPVNKVGAGRGRLLFAMDATASREPTWDHAARLQGEMFQATAELGGLDVQRPLARGVSAVVAAEAVVHDVGVVEIRRHPGHRRVAIVAVVATGDVRRMFAGCRYAIMTRAAGTRLIKRLGNSTTCWNCDIFYGYLLH